MSSRSTLVGRREERERLEAALRSAQRGGGSLVLLAGEAGVGKTRLAAEIAQESGLGVLWGLASHGAAAPYGPLVAALRAGLRVDPEALDAIGPMRPHLALLLPELGDPAPVSDRATLFEALHCAFAQIARDRDVLVVLDDLQWSDEATLELLPALAEALSRLPLLVLAAYRSDGLPRDHKLRRLRYELRRASSSTSWLSRRSTRPLPRSCSGSCSTERRRRRWPARSMTARRACPSSSRSWRGRSWSPAPWRTAAAGSSSRTAARCRCPTPCATRC